MIAGTGRRPDFLLPSIAKTLVWTIALGAALLLWATPATAASCGERVIDDWYGNGRVDDVYPLHCYRDALKLLPEDAKNYSDAPDAIRRALQDAIRQQRATPPPPPPTTTESDATGGPGSGDGSQGGGSAGPTSPPPANPGGSDGTPAGPTGGDEPSGGVLSEAIEKFGPDKADSIPVPLLVVAGLALLLLAAGSAGLVARRIQGRRVQSQQLDKPHQGT